MKIIDSCPILSQVKSLIQVIGGDAEGAKRTQENFAFENTFPVISQVVSAGHAIAGYPEKAKDLQLQFLKEAEGIVDSVPIIGHTKGVVHYAMGDTAKGDASMKAASRSVGVAVGGVGGMVACGPICAVSGGMLGGTATDMAITMIDSAASGEARPYGNVASVGAVLEHVQGGRKLDAEEAFVMATVPILDGFTGWSKSTSGVTGNIANSLKDIKNLPAPGSVRPDIGLPFNLRHLPDINNN